MTTRFRALYGDSPLQLLGVLACLAVAGVALIHLFDAGPARSLAFWLGGAIVGHDLVLYPLYALLDRAGGGALGLTRRRGLINYVRIPTLLSGLMLLVYFPLILAVTPKYQLYSHLGNDVYLGRWLLLSGCLFAGSALLYVLAALRARGGATRTGGG